MKWLKLTNPMMNGPEVTRLQEILTALGYDLGENGIDGVYGEDTAEAVRQFQRKYGLISDGAVGNLETWPMFKQVLEAQGRKNPSTEPEIIFVDRREQHAPPALYRNDLSPRSWTGEGDNVISGVVLHQSGCIVSEVTRAYDVGSFHIIVLRSGKIVLSNPMEFYIEHAGPLSGRTIAIEFEGNFPGIAGNPETAWNIGSELNALTYAQLKAADFLFAWLLERFFVNGGTWKYVYAHRQVSKERQADPGSEIWTKIGVKWIERLKLEDTNSVTFGDGLPIPKSWDPKAEAGY